MASQTRCLAQGFGATNIRQALPADLRDDPLAVLADHNASISRTQLALELFVANGPGLGTSSDRERYAQSKVGTQALKWFSIVGERETEFLFEWMQIEHVPEFARALPQRQVSQMRSVLLAQAIEATACWDGLDSAVKAFVQAMSWVRTLSHEQRPSLAWPGMWLAKRLRRAASPPVTPWSQEQVIKSLKIWETEPLQRAYAEAQLWLAHPSSPKTAPAYQFFKSCQSGHSPLLRILLNPRDKNARQAFAFFLIRTAQCLDAEGKVEQAYEVLDYGQMCVPECFAMRGKSVELTRPEAKSRRTLASTETRSSQATATFHRAREGPWQMREEERRATLKGWR